MGRREWMIRIGSVCIVLLGLLLLLYPWISNYLFDHRVDSTVRGYQEIVEETNQDDLQMLRRAAENYNASLIWGRTLPGYESALAMDDSGLMGFVEIPKIDVYLPIYHGTDSDVLARGVGHIPGSSLPLGGEGCRSVLSAHTGINSSKMFSDLTALEEEDLFLLHVLDETLAYRVCDIQVILPEETKDLVPDPHRDLSTLITCTPYGVNSHRLVVTGERTEWSPEVMSAQTPSSGEILTDSTWRIAYQKALFLGITIAVPAVALFLWFERRVRRTMA